MAFGTCFVFCLFLLGESLAQDEPVTGSKTPFDNPVQAETELTMSVCLFC